MLKITLNLRRIQYYILHHTYLPTYCGDKYDPFAAYLDTLYSAPRLGRKKFYFLCHDVELASTASIEWASTSSIELFG